MTHQSIARGAAEWLSGPGPRGPLGVHVLEQPDQVARAHLLGRQHLLRRGQAQDHAEDRGHRPVAGERPVVEDAVLEPAPLERHEHRPVERVDRREDTLGAGLEPQRVGRADAGADTAAKAELGVQDGLAPLRPMRVVGRDEGHRLDRARDDALAAAVTPRLVHLGEEVGRVDRVEEAEPPRRDHRLSAAAAAVADERDLALDVLAELDQVVAVRLLQEVHPLGPVGAPRAPWP